MGEIMDVRRIYSTSARIRRELNGAPSPRVLMRYCRCRHCSETGCRSAFSRADPWRPASGPGCRSRGVEPPASAPRVADAQGELGELPRGGAGLPSPRFAEAQFGTAALGRHRAGDMCDLYIRMTPDRHRRPLPLWATTNSYELAGGCARRFRSDPARQESTSGSRSDPHMAGRSPTLRRSVTKRATTRMLSSSLNTTPSGQHRSDGTGRRRHRPSA